MDTTLQGRKPCNEPKQAALNCLNMQKTNPSLFTNEYIYHKNNLYLKRALDRVLALAILTLLSPLFLALIAGILIEAAVSPKSNGPVFVRETRISAGKPFTFFKFRTYYVPDAHTLKQLNKKPGDFINNHLSNTYMGAILRKFYLDELPQLAHILKGEMSFVGPRPYPEKAYYELLTTGLQSKRILKGGLCFPVQALKGKWDEHPDRLEQDEMVIKEYLAKSAIGVVLLDFKIMFKTFCVVLRGEGI